MRLALVLMALLAHGKHRGPPPSAPADGPSSGPGYALAAPVTLEAVVNEDTEAAELMRLSQVEGLTIRVAPTGNMLRPEALAVVRRLPAPALLLRAPLMRAHVEMVQKLPGVPVTVDLGSSDIDPATLALLGQLGPRELQLHVDAEGRLPAYLGRLPRGLLVVSFGRRVPGPEEMQALLALHQVTAELSAEAPLAALQAVVDAGVRTAIVAADDRIPAPMLEVLSRYRRPVEVVLSGQAALSDASRLSAIPSLQALAFRFEHSPVVPADAAERLKRMRPPPLAAPTTPSGP